MMIHKFLCLVSDDAFQTMCEAINRKFKFSDLPGSEQVWEKGQACVAFYEKDQSWHRATILAIEPDKVQV